MTYTLDVRPEVAAFAQLMETTLRVNDHKPGWKYYSRGALIGRLREEVDELISALQKALYRRPELGDEWFGQHRANEWLENEDSERIGQEAADVANFAMMIADVCGSLRAISVSPPQGPGCARYTKHTDPCLTKATDDEAIFVLRGQDALASEVIDCWITTARQHHVSEEKIRRAYEHRLDLDAWQNENPERVKVPD